MGEDSCRVSSSHFAWFFRVVGSLSVPPDNRPVTLPVFPLWLPRLLLLRHQHSAGCEPATSLRAVTARSLNEPPSPQLRDPLLERTDVQGVVCFEAGLPGD